MIIIILDLSANFFAKMKVKLGSKSLTICKDCIHTYIYIFGTGISDSDYAGADIVKLVLKSKMKLRDDDF